MNLCLPDASNLQGRLDELAAKHSVPGATAGVLLGGRRVVCATGVARLDSPVPVTPGSLFLIASVTKVWTATLVMQLVDEGKVLLDAPVSDQLEPRLRLGDPEVADTVTVAQLLCHTGGFLGDSPEPPFRDDDAVRRTIESYAELPQVHRPGTMFSYSNAGYNVLGRLVECATGLTWDEALRTRLLEPLGLRSTATLPEEIMVHPHAVGHEPVAPDSLDLEPVTSWLDPRGSGPCGGTLATSAGDLLAFAGMHLADGMGPDGRRVLSEESARAMREPRMVQPDPSLSPAWGLGWAIERLGDPLVIGHGGNTCGQESQLVVVPELGLAICVLATGDVQGLLREQLVGELLDDLAGVRRPGLPAPSAEAVDVEPFLGSYDRGTDLHIDVVDSASGLEIRFVTAGPLAEHVPSFSSPLTYAGGTTFLLTLPPMTEQIAVTFLHEDGPDGPATHLSIGLRVAPRL